MNDLSRISKPTVMMEMTRTSNRTKIKMKHGMRPVRPPEEGEMKTKEEIEVEMDINFEKAEMELSENLRLLNLFIDKADDIIRLQQKASKEFHKALGGGDRETAQKVIVEVKCLEEKKKTFTDMISGIGEGLDELEEFNTKFDVLDVYSDRVRSSLANTKQRRDHLKLMTAHIIRMLPRLESAIQDHKDAVEVERYLAKQRSSGKPIQQRVTAIGTEKNVILERRATEMHIDQPTWEKADLLPVTKEMRAVLVLKLYYADMEMVISEMENTSPINHRKPQMGKILNLSHAVEMEMRKEEVTTELPLFNGMYATILHILEPAPMQTEDGLYKDSPVKGEIVKKIQPVVEIIGNLPKMVPRKVLWRTTVTPNYKFRKKYISTIYGQLFDKMDNRKEFAWIILRENTRNIVCEHGNEAFIGSVKGTILVELMIVAFNIIIPFDRGKMINR